MLQVRLSRWQKPTPQVGRTPSSTRPSQLSSSALQISLAKGWMLGSLGAQSPPIAA
jgi:hypothetical protein